MKETFTPARAAAFRAALVGQVGAAKTPPKQALIVASLVLAGAVGGAGITTAAYASGGRFASVQSPAVPSGQPSLAADATTVAPPGVQPGAPIISVLGKTSILNILSATEIPITDRPDAATHVRVTLTALTPGSVSWGTDPSGNNPSLTTGQADVDAKATSEYDFPLESTTQTLFVQPSGGFTGILTYEYLNYIPTHLARNAQGNSYGVEGGPDGAPDLIYVSGTSADGRPVLGYASAAELSASSPDHPGLPTSPTEALKWQDEIRKKYPHGWNIPVYNSDGTTQIGTFHIGN
jgi:hypothetical protein